MSDKRFSICAVVLLSACSSPRPATPPPDLGAVPRMEWNRLAAELALPLFWRSDANGNGVLDADELAVTWSLVPTQRAEWVGAAGLTPKLLDAHQAIVARQRTGLPPQADAAEARRLELLRQELAAGRFTLVETDLAAASPAERTFVERMLAVGEKIGDLHLQQIGSFGLRSQIPRTDSLSRMVFWLNQGPWCSAPTTEKDKDCNALASRPKELSGLYPAEVQQDEGFCDLLAKRADQETLFHQFSVVGRNAAGELVALPYNQAYRAEMAEIAGGLEAAAAALPAGEEPALKEYLHAAAQAFLDNDWFKADEAWARMNAENSKWYLRIGPDETYFEPCARKAGFHMSFARINSGSLVWQQKLEPVKNDLEKAVAAKAGAPYQSRQVSFHLPDFIDIVANAGDARSPRGATIGQSLPNWGPVANENRGRTVVMTNFYTDPDSRAAWRSQVESLFCPSSMASLKDDLEPQLMSTVLHEAAHNLGPSHEYRVNGKTDDQIFGGPLAATMEELKAQTAALFLAHWLSEKGVIPESMEQQAHTYDITWAMGHISRGMYTADNRPKAYSQLAAIQVGFLIDAGAITWKQDEIAANGKDTGCFALDLAAFPKAIDALAAQAFGLKARGDVALAQSLKQKYVDAPGPWADLRAVITERWLRSPQASFVYSVRY